MHACMHVSGWRDVWMSGGRTPLCFARIHQPASAILHTRTHACVQCMRSACVAPSLRIPPHQASGLRGGHPNLPGSLLFASVRFRKQPKQHIPRLGSCLPACQTPATTMHVPPGVPALRARTVPRHRHRDNRLNTNTTRNTHLTHIHTLLYTVRAILGNLYPVSRSLW